VKILVEFPLSEAHALISEHPKPEDRLRAIERIEQALRVEEGTCGSCDNTGRVLTGECRTAMSGPTCRNPKCPPCQTPEVEPCDECDGNIGPSAGIGAEEPQSRARPSAGSSVPHQHRGIA
jgi:hypothetical protein